MFSVEVICSKLIYIQTEEVKDYIYTGSVLQSTLKSHL